jgi:BTB And C-terminal Kelch.
MSIQRIFLPLTFTITKVKVLPLINVFFFSEKGKKRLTLVVIQCLLCCILFPISLHFQNWCFIDSEELFTEDMAFLLYCDATKYKNTVVMKIMIPCINKFFLTLVSTENFLELTVNLLYALLSSSNVCVHR